MKFRNQRVFRVIARERLNIWYDRLVENNATPQLLLAVGHEEREGEVHICVPEDMPKDLVLFYVKSAAEMLEKELAE